MAIAFDQKQIEIAAKLYKCRDQAVFIRGEEGFRNEVAKWKPLFDEIMNEESCSELEALIILLRRAKGERNEGVMMHLLSAVGCELAEPKYTTEHLIMA